MSTRLPHEQREARRALLNECLAATGLTQGEFGKSIGAKSQGQLWSWFLRDKAWPLERALRVERATAGAIPWHRFYSTDEACQLRSLLSEAVA